MSSRTGGCVCGAVRYTADNVRPVWYCHCEQCRRITGHFMAASQVDLDDIKIEGEPTWYYVNEQSRYGFCPGCGATVFWRNETNPYLSVTAGSLDSAEGLTDKGHIFTAEKGEYYDIPETSTQSERWPSE